jgi:hypothetical protein
VGVSKFSAHDRRRRLKLAQDGLSVNVASRARCDVIAARAGRQAFAGLAELILSRGESATVRRDCKLDEIAVRIVPRLDRKEAILCAYNPHARAQLTSAGDCPSHHFVIFDQILKVAHLDLSASGK